MGASLRNRVKANFEEERLWRAGDEELGRLPGGEVWCCERRKVGGKEGLRQEQKESIIRAYWSAFLGGLVMSGGYLADFGSGNRRGFIALLMLLIVVVAGILIYFVTMGGSIDQAPTAEQLANPDEYPWVEEHRLRKEGEEAEYAPSAEQADLSGGVQILADVKEGQYARGSIRLAIGPDGLIEGAWGADYGTVSPRIDYTVMMCKFEGNTDPSKIYSDEEGEEPSLLFLICKGKFLILESNMETGKVRKVTGYIYVVGWIAPDLSAFGRVHLTSDKKTQQIFDWEGQATPRGAFRLPGL